jgi:hypothetical protein
MENSAKVSQKIKHSTTIGSSNPTTEHKSKGTEISILKGNMYSHVFLKAIR